MINWEQDFKLVIAKLNSPALYTRQLAQEVGWLKFTLFWVLSRGYSWAALAF